MAIPFMSTFALSTIAPVGFTLAIKFSEKVAILLTKEKGAPAPAKNKETKPENNKKVVQKPSIKEESQRSKGNKIILLVLMLLYPSIANQAFLMFRCRTVAGTGLTSILEKDYSVECYTGSHAQYIWLAFVAILVYAVGVPMILFYLLWNMRHHLHEKNVTEKNRHHHLEVKSRLGQFFMQCKCMDNGTLTHWCLEE